MLSRLWSAIVTIETLTGLDMPTPGRISTVPSIRGYTCQHPPLRGEGAHLLRRHSLELTKVAEIPGYPTRKFVFGRPDTRTNALIFS